MTEEAKYTAENLAQIGARWLERIKGAEKREERWFKVAERAEKLYLMESEQDRPAFNILHSNVETIVPALINSEPKADVRPRHNASDQVGKQISDLLERAIATQVDDSALQKEIEAETADAYMAGRGVVRLKFDATVLGGQVSDERVLFEVVSWRDYREGPSRSWREVPWVAFAHFIATNELEDLRKLPKPEDKEESTDEDDDDLVWEIWCKDTKKVYFVIERNGEVLDIRPDPLGLKGFFPMPEPLQPITGTGKRIPVCPYSAYEEQAEELDRITKRINKIVSGVKVRGLIAGDSSNIGKLVELGDNELAVADNLEGLAATGGLDKAVLWWPLETAIAVLRELYQDRELVKQSIYEITGISDIVRGASNAAETATAQTIKNKWGSLRIKRMQQQIQRQVRDIFVLTAEIMWRHFSPQRIAEAAGVPLTPEIMEALQAPLNHYRIDIESDSTVRADLTEAKSEMGQFLTATGEFLQIAMPVSQQQPEMAGALVEIYSSFARQFSLGKQAEDALDQMAEQTRQRVAQGDPETQKQKMRADEAYALEMDGKRAELAKTQAETGKIGAETQKISAEHGLKVNAQRLDEAKEVNANLFKMEELDLERDQQRPVGIS